MHFLRNFAGVRNTRKGGGCMHRWVWFLFLPGSVAVAATPGSVVTFNETRFGTLVSIVEPVGSSCEVSSTDPFFGQPALTVPFKFRADKKFLYTMECSLPGGKTWRKAFRPNPGVNSVFRIGVAGESEDKPIERKAAQKAAFRQVLQDVRSAKRTDDRLSIVEYSTARFFFSPAQTKKLLKAFPKKQRRQVARLAKPNKLAVR